MTGPEKRYQAALNKGHSAAWEQKWEQASVYYKQALNEKPDDLKALSNLALALFEIRAYKESIDLYLVVAEKTPNDPIPFEKIAVIYDAMDKSKIGSKVAVKAAEIFLNSGDVEKAIENWERATVMDPENVVAHSRLAIVCERMNRIPQAVGAYLRIASIMQHKDQIDKAVQVINRVFKLSPDDNEANKALAALREGKMLPYPIQSRRETSPFSTNENALLEEPKIEVANEQTPIEEAKQKALSELAELFFTQTDEEERKNGKTGGLKQIVDGTGSSFAKDVYQTKLRLHLGQVVEKLSQGENNQAVDDLKRLIDIGLHHPAVYYHLGVIRYENNRLESAIKYLKQSTNHKDYALASRLLIAQALMMRGQIDEAAIENLEALKIADSGLVPDDQADDIRQLYDPMIEALSQKTNEDNSEKIYNSISEILNQSDWRKILLKIREGLLEESDHPTPIAKVLTAVRSSQVVVAMSSIRQLAREGRRHAAFEEALFALQEAPTYLPLHIAIGDILIAGNQIEAAIEKYKVVARSYNVRGEGKKVVEMLRRVVDLSPLDMKARENLIDQLEYRGQNEDAIEEYEKIAEVYYSLAELANARKTYMKALRFIEQVNLGKQRRVNILQKIADIDVQSLNWRQGLAIYDKICLIVPDDPETNRNRIDLCLRMGDRKQAYAAIEDYMQLLKRENRHDEVIDFLVELSDDWAQEAMIRNLLGDQYRDLGRTRDAIDQYDIAQSTFFDQGNFKSAMVILKRIISLNPDNVDEYRQLLESYQQDEL